MVDYIVEPRSDKFLCDWAKETLEHFNVDLTKKVDVCRLVTRPGIKTVSGEKRLTFEAVADEEMGDDDGLTSYAANTVSIQLRASVWDRARLESGRDRMTVAHELGHAVLHHGPPLSRKTVEPPRPAYIPPPRSAERQAKVFAAQIMMPDRLVIACKSAEEIAALCTVSWKAAQIRFQQLNIFDQRRDFAARMRALAKELQNDELEKKGPEFLPDPCPSCGKLAVQAIGCKYMCMLCDNVSDKFQDGD